MNIVNLTTANSNVSVYSLHFRYTFTSPQQGENYHHWRSEKNKFLISKQMYIYYIYI